MSLTAKQIELIQESFQKVAAIADTAAELFYGRLFEIAPEVKPLFSNASDMTVQGRKLMSMLGTAVAGLKHLDRITPAVKALGARHVGYQVQDEHYEIVGQALIWTLAKGLGADFTEEVETAWTTMYAFLAEIAIAGAHESQETEQSS